MKCTTSPPPPPVHFASLNDTLQHRTSITDVAPLASLCISFLNAPYGSGLGGMDMPDYRRLYIPGGTYFFTVNLADRRARLLTDHIHHLRAAWKRTAADWPFETVAVCILPDHLHCIWTLPENDYDFATRWRLIKSRFSRALPAASDPAQGRRPGERGIWQRRFWEHAIRDETDLSNHIDYIHWNPVKHGHVAEMDDWPFSSWHRFKADYGKEWNPPIGDNFGEM